MSGNAPIDLGTARFIAAMEPATQTGSPQAYFRRYCEAIGDWDLETR
ncbi:MAG: hypothetical protein WCJ35_19280 [Planctomycetota bacterium]